MIAGRGSQFDPSVIDAFASLFSTAPARPKLAMLRLSTAELRAGQILAKDFVSPEGVLLLSAGQRLGDDLIERIQGFERKHGLSLLLSVQPLPEGAR